MQQQLESRLRRSNYRFQKHFIANQMYVIAFDHIGSYLFQYKVTT